MSVEDIQKVNKMAQEFLDQGFASSREEAVKKAQEMLDKHIAEDRKPESAGESQQHTCSESGEDLAKLKNMIERTKAQFESQFAGYKNALIALEKEIRRIDDQVKSIRSGQKPSTPTAAPAPKPQQETQAEQKQEDAQQQTQGQENQGESHPKKGQYSSDDVAVDKVFYFGNK